MIRINLVLLLAVVLSAMYLVNVQYESRRLFVELNKATAEANRLESEHGRLVVEKRAQATPGRVEKLAREKLAMRQVTPAITNYVNYNVPASLAAATQPKAAAQGADSVSASAPQEAPAQPAAAPQRGDKPVATDMGAPAKGGTP